MAPLSVAILAGGMSRRMGRDKALLRIGDRTLLEITAQRAASVGNDLFVVASHRDAYARFGFRVVPDVFENAGSLGGVYSAVRHARNEYCLVVACDMPLLSPLLLQFMAQIPRDFDVLVPVLAADRSNQGGDRTFETLHAIYARSVLISFERRIRDSELKIADALIDLRVRELDEGLVRSLDPDILSFFNVNTPDDLEFARRTLELGQ